MKIKGFYRDIMSENNQMLFDNGWKSNSIVEDYGRFLAALMKKSFSGESTHIGVEYIAVAGHLNSTNPGNNTVVSFRNRLVAYMAQASTNEPAVLITGNDWIWVKKIQGPEVEFLDSNGAVTNNITNTLRFDLKFEQQEPAANPNDFVFEEFGLFGIPPKDSGRSFNTDKLFLVNYVSHGGIAKTNTMDLSRTIQLTFPIN